MNLDDLTAAFVQKLEVSTAAAFYETTEEEISFLIRHLTSDDEAAIIRACQQRDNMKLTEFEKSIIRTEAKDFPTELDKHDYVRDHVIGSLVTYEEFRSQLMERPEAKEMLARLRGTGGDDGASGPS